MREIKFRAWDKEMEEMHNVDRIQFDVDEIDVIIKKNEGSEHFYAIPFQEIELMQYTGLKDKKGREIYEGDILKNSQGYLEKVIFINGSFRVTSITFPNISIYLLSSYGGCIEVIGNIYKNPELLEAK